MFRRCPWRFVVASVRKGWCLGAPTHGRGRDPREGGPHPDDRHATPGAVDRDRSSLFAERGYEATSIEEIAQRAHVSKPVVYEHFGGKEGLYAVVVDREMSRLLEMVTSSLKQNRSRIRVERVALALLTYVEEHTDGFRILVRDSPVAAPDGTYSSLLNEAIGQVGTSLQATSRGEGSIRISPCCTRRRWSEWCPPPRRGGWTSGRRRRRSSPRISSTCAGTG